MADESDRRKSKKKRKHNRDAYKEHETPTVSIAVSGSIIDNAQSLELATLLAGQIARAATIFRVDEVVVFDSVPDGSDASTAGGEDESGARFLARILEYLETPQYLRRRLFPMHNNLKYVGLLPPLDAPHHVRKHEWSHFREGVTLEGNSSPNGTLVDVGLSKIHERVGQLALVLGKRLYHLDYLLSAIPATFATVSFMPNVELWHRRPGHPLNTRFQLLTQSGALGNIPSVVVEQVLEPGLRVTVAMGSDRNLGTDCLRKVVMRCSPREEKGLYWGYTVRYASNLSRALKSCPYKSGYDHVIGTSEHGLVVNSSDLILPTFRHLLITFGGLAGLEESIEEDTSLKGKQVSDVFNAYLNTCPSQGSRTIRTEEAIFISLQYFQEPVERAVKRFEGKSVLRND